MSDLQRHVDRYRGSCSTDVQRAEFDRLIGLDKTPWPMKWKGASVIGEARRFFETGNNEKIGHALYDFSIQGSGGFNDIAHFNLYGFRAEYPHPLIYITELVAPEARRWPMSYRQDPDGYHSFGVYTDGLHKGKVAHEIILLANLHLDRLKADFVKQAQDRKLEQLHALADELGFAMQPPLRRVA